MNVILIPAYKPDDELLKLIEKLDSYHFPILVVDDGSGESCREVFEQAAKKATVIHNSENMGKGATLKNGMRKLREIYPECTSFITVDADGQHKVEDIVRVAEALDAGASMVLTMRDFKGDIPPKSKFGNGLSRWVYTVLTGQHWPDNQSGLRGFSVNHIDWLLNVAGEKYDYEINVIFHADMQKIKIATVTIESVYINGNQSTHFDPIKDTIRIYKCLFTSAIGKLISAVLYLILVIVAYVLFGNAYWWLTIFVAGVVAAVVCLLIELISFRQFKHKKRTGNFLCAIFRSMIYTLGSGGIILLLPKLPILFTFIIISILLIPVRYIKHRQHFYRNQRHEA